MTIPEIKSIVSESTKVVTTQTSDGANLNTTVASNNAVETTVSSSPSVYTTHNVVPQVVTTITKDIQDITTVVDGFWEVVWSVNGQTGDVLIDVVLGEFQANTTYTKGAAITYDGKLYAAKSTFTSGSTFDATDWTLIEPDATIAYKLFQANHEYQQREAIWYDGSIYVANEAFTSGSTFDPDDWTQASGGGSAEETTYDNTTSGLTAENVQDALDEIADGYVEKETGKGLSTNDYTTSDKTAVSNISSTIDTKISDRFGVFYNANTDRTVTTNRATALLYVINNLITSGFGYATIRYSGGYYYKCYIMTGTSSAESSIIEVNSYNKQVMLWGTNNTKTTCTLVRTFDDDARTYAKNYADAISTALSEDISDLNTAITTIQSKIPSQATSSNQLADKNFVNSTIQTETANFRGNWANWAAVPSDASQYPEDYKGSTTPTVNDYLVIVDASDYTGATITGTWRFKYGGVWATNGKSGWNREYQINESPMTAAQLAALNSGITAAEVTRLADAVTTTGETTYSEVTPSITSAMITDGAITTTKLAATSVTSAKLADDSVVEAKIADDAVTTDKVADGAIVEDKIADDAVTTDKIEDGAVSKVKMLWSEVLSAVYPVGSIYISATLATPAAVATALGGGTWEAWGAGRVPVGVDTSQTEFDTAEETGGEKTHQLVESELPNISASWRMHGQENGTEFYGLNGYATGTKVQMYTNTNSQGTGAYSYQTPGFSFGQNGSHNNLQPYITCYMYKRTA